MANRSSADVAFLLIDGYSVMGDTTDIMDKITATLEENWALGDAWKASAFVGIREAKFQQNGFFNDATGRSNQALVDATLTGPGISRILCYGYETNAKRGRMVGFSGAMQIDYTRITQRAVLHKANATYQGSGVVEESQICHELAAETTTTGNTQATSVDQNNFGFAMPITSSSVANPSVITTPVAHGLTSGDIIVITGHAGSTPTINGGNGYAVTVTSTTTFTIPVNVTVGGTGGTFTKVSSASGSVYLQVSALSLGSSTNIIVTMQDSADNSTFADISGGAFAAVTAAPNAQRLAIAGTIRRYTAARWVYTAFGGGPTCTFMAAVHRN